MCGAHKDSYIAVKIRRFVRQDHNFLHMTLQCKQISKYKYILPVPIGKMSQLKMVLVSHCSDIFTSLCLMFGGFHPTSELMAKTGVSL